MPMGDPPEFFRLRAEKLRKVLKTGVQKFGRIGKIGFCRNCRMKPVPIERESLRLSNGTICSHLDGLADEFRSSKVRTKF